MNRIARLFATVAMTSFANLAFAGDNPVVVELYTSQGCSSCPPADAFFANELVGRDDVIALALHVDYWDYIGWKDDFANPAYSERQRNYARVAGKRSVYTPQMVIGGLDHVVGTHPDQVNKFIQKHAAASANIQVDLERIDDGLTVKLVAADDAAGSYVVQLVRYSDLESRNIRRGENAGRTIDYANIVTHWETLGEWNGKRDKTMQASLSGDGQVVVLVQQSGFGPIKAAARLR